MQIGNKDIFISRNLLGNTVITISIPDSCWLEVEESEAWKCIMDKIDNYDKPGATNKEFNNWGKDMIREIYIIVANKTKNRMLKEKNTALSNETWRMISLTEGLYSLINASSPSELFC